MKIKMTRLLAVVLSAILCLQMSGLSYPNPVLFLIFIKL